MKIQVLNTHKNLLMTVMFLASIFIGDNLKAQIVCGPVNTLYQTVGNATLGKTEIYRYNNFQQTYLKVGELPGVDNTCAPNSAYNATTQLIYSNLPADGGNVVRVFDPANNYNYIGKITITGNSQPFNNTLFAQDQYIGFVNGTKVVRIDVTNISSYPATRAVKESTIATQTGAANDYSLIGDEIYGVPNGTTLRIINLTTNAVTNRTITFNNALDGQINQGTAFGATWQDRNGNFYFFSNSGGGIYKIADVVNPLSTVAEKVLLANTSGQNDGFGCEIGPDPLDWDDDKIPNRIDIDDDNDGILDVNESPLYIGIDPGGDNDHDGIYNFRDRDDPSIISIAPFVDVNGDSINDNFDFDLDGIPDSYDLDSDNDGIPDNVEAQSTMGYVLPSGVDANHNGLDDIYEKNGKLGLTPPNTDHKGYPDYLDLDSDDDGIYDTKEAGITLKGKDSDLDGLDDAIDVSINVQVPYGKISDPKTFFPDSDGDKASPGGDVDYRDPSSLDTDNDGIPDVIDLDDDNDGILDTNEYGIYSPFGDEDGDGIYNYADVFDNNYSSDGSKTSYVDSNHDGIPDVYDTDLDGIINSLDKDSDGDGCNDANEAYGLITDTNNDGTYGAVVGPGQVNPDGTVKLASYTAPVNLDSSSGDTNLDFLQKSKSLTSIGTQPASVSTTSTATKTFSVVVNTAGTGTAETYIWQEQVGGTGPWNTVANGGVYSNTTTANMSIVANRSLDGNKYRVLISTPSDVCDSDLTSNAVLLSVTNSAPVAVGDTKTTAEDTPVTISVIANDTDIDGNATINVATVDLDPATTGIQNSFTSAHGIWNVDNLGVVTFTPSLDYNGTESITYTVNDASGAVSNQGLITVTVVPVNDAPSFVKGANQSNCINGGSQIINSWASSLSPGPANESSQNLSFIVSNNNNSLFSTPPSIDAAGNLRYKIAANQTGTAVVSVQIIDDGGTANGGVDRSAVQTFTINVAQPAAPIASVSTQPTCAAATGTITVSSPTGAGYSYSIDGIDYSNTTGIFNSVGSGTYSITVRLPGCSNTSTTVTVNPQPATPVQPTFGTVTQPSCATVTGSFVIANYDSSYSYLINPSNGVGRSGATVFAASGTYTVSAVSSLGCSSVANTIRLDNIICPTNDSGSVAAAGGTAIFNVLSNDKVGGVQATFANATIATSGTWPAGITLDTTTGAVNVAAGLAAGTYTITYTICDKLTTPVCSTATITVVVEAVPNHPPVAVDDNYTVLEGESLNIMKAGGVLKNDTDQENNQLIAILTSGPAHGTLTLNQDGSFSYTHDGSETTSDSFTYKVNDGTVDGNVATVTINVTPVNDAPVAVADSYTVDEGGTLTPAAPGVLANDTDVDSSTLKAILVTNPVHGTLALNADGSFTYVHDGSETTSDSYTYKVNDGLIDGNTVKVSITVTPVNDAPVAVDDFYTGIKAVAEGGTLNIAAKGVLANDTDAEGNTLKAILMTNPAHGTLTLNGNGSFIYVHDGSETTGDSFTYKVNDGFVDGNTATVTIEIIPVNDAPVAVADSYTVAEGGNLTVAAAGVLANDTDAENNTLKAILVTNPAHGRLTLNQNGSFTYDHDGSETTSDSYTYKVNDGTVDGNTVTVSITVTPVNDAPVAVADNYTVAEGGTLTVAASGVLANDTDAEHSPLTAILVSNPVNGTLTFNADGSFNYIHNGSETTSDSFTYKVNDGLLDSAPVTVSITVTPVNDAPVAVADSYTVAEGATLTVDIPGVLANDTDAENNTLKSILVTSPAHGRLTLNQNGSFTYEHDGSETTSDSFEYKVNDGLVDGNTVTVSISISPVNDAPVAVEDSYTVAEGGTLTIAAPGVLANDTDAEGSALTAILMTSPVNGTLTHNADGSFTYVHNGGETTFDSYTYKVNDGTVDGNTVTVSITITPVNDAPVALDDATNANIPSRAGATPINALKATDVDGTIASYTVLTLPANGTLVLAGVAVTVNQVLTPAQAASLSYDPSGAYSGVDIFTFTATDNSGATALSPATITINVDKTIINAAADTVNSVVRVGQIVTVVNVLNNDLLSNSPVVAADVNLKEITADPNGVLKLKADGSVEVTPNSPAGTYTLTYEICEKANPTNCASATVSVTVVKPVIVAGADNGTPINGYVGGTVLANVLTNDTLNGTAVDAADVVLTKVSGNANISLSGNSVVVAAGTPAGTYTLTYSICESLYLDNCATAVVSVLVTEPGITATDVIVNGINGINGGKVSDVLANDTLNGAAVNTNEVTISLVSPLQSNISLVGTDVIIAPITPAGTYTLTYQICEILNPTNCARANVIVTVDVPGVDVTKDAGTVNGLVGGTAVDNVLANDIYNGAVIAEDMATVKMVSTTNSNIALVGTAVVVAPGTPAGEYKLIYEVCSIAFATNCAQATVTVTVTAPGFDLKNDTGTPIVGKVGGTAVTNVLDNDTYNDGTITDALATTTPMSSSDARISMVGKSVVVAPGTPAGSYSLVYQVCSTLNTNICATATVFVTVTAPAIVAANDTVTLDNGYTGGTAVDNVLANDKLNGSTVTESEVKITTVSSENSNISLVGTAVIVKAGTPAGTYKLIYNICEILNPNNCAQGTVTVTVTAPAIVAVKDTADPISGYVGGTVLSNVLANDTLNGVAVIATEVKTTFVSSTNSNITLVGTAVKVAAGTPAGTYILVYSICDKLNPINCSQTTVLVTVTAPAIVVRDGAGSINGYVGGTALTNVLTNATLNGAPVIPSEVKTTFVSSTNPNITLSGTNVVVAPGTPAGTYTLNYTVCEIANPTNCVQGTVTIIVNAPPIAAVSDTAAPINGYVGGTAFVNVLANDKLNGTAVKAAEVNTTFVSSTDQKITLLGTNVIVAAGTPAGTYSLTYSICEKLNPDNCSQTTVTVTVTAAAIIVRDSAGLINGYVGGTVANVLTNATLNGAPVIASEVKTTFVSSTNPNVTLSGNNVVVAPGTPAGTYKLIYTVCEILNPTNCAQATITVKVTAPLIAAVNDLGTPINGFVGGTALVNVLTNDTLNGTAVIASEVNLTFVSSTSANISLSGTSVVVAAGTAAGTYSLTYSICEKLNPTNCSVANVRVTVNAPAIVGVDDKAASILGHDGGIALANVLDNDTINGIPVNPSDVKVTFVSSTHPNITLSGTTVVVAPDTPNGIYTLTYSICEKLNPNNCTEATVKVAVVSHAIAAGDDSVTLNNGNVGGASLLNVLANDKLNGSSIYAPEIILRGKDIPFGITLKDDGRIDVAAGIAAGTYTLTYEICEAVNSSNCSVGTVSIFVEVPAVALLETVALNDSNGNGYAEVGESLTYNFTVTNTGNTDLENIKVSDPRPGMTITGGPINLAAGASDDYSFVGTYVLTQADVDARTVVTQGTALGTSQSGVVAEDKSDPASLNDNNPTVFELNGCVIKVFNAVSPNGDSKNERFYIQGIECYPDNTVSIFNRWGVLVYERDHYNNTDVVFKGFSEGRATIKNSDKLPEGSYYYVVKYKDGQSSPHQEVGYLYLSK